MKKIIASATFIAAFAAFTAKAQMSMPVPETLEQYAGTSQLQQLTQNPGSAAIDTQGLPSGAGLNLLNTPEKTESGVTNQTQLKQANPKPVKQEKKRSKEKTLAVTRKGY